MSNEIKDIAKLALIQILQTAQDGIAGTLADGLGDIEVLAKRAIADIEKAEQETPVVETSTPEVVETITPEPSAETPAPEVIEQPATEAETPTQSVADIDAQIKAERESKKL